MALVAVLLMQLGHWPAFRLMPRVRFRRNVLLGHVLECIGELSLFFIAALATVIVFDRFRELEFVWWKALVLASLLFTVTCYKHMIMSVGDRLIEGKDFPLSEE